MGQTSSHHQVTYQMPAAEYCPLVIKKRSWYNKKAWHIQEVLNKQPRKHLSNTSSLYPFVTVLPFASFTWSLMLMHTSSPTFRQQDLCAPDFVSCRWLWWLRWPCVPVSAQPAFSCEMSHHTALLHMPGQSNSASFRGHTGAPGSIQPRHKLLACPVAASPVLDKAEDSPGIVLGEGTDLSASSLWWGGGPTWGSHQSWGCWDETRTLDWLCFRHYHVDPALWCYPGDGGVQRGGRCWVPQGHGTPRWAWWVESDGAKRRWSMDCEFWWGLRRPGVPCVAVDGSLLL